jgi:hypothetical protein
VSGLGESVIWGLAMASGGFCSRGFDWGSFFFLFLLFFLLILNEAVRWLRPQGAFVTRIARYSAEIALRFGGVGVVYCGASIPIWAWHGFYAGPWPGMSSIALASEGKEGGKEVEMDWSRCRRCFLFPPVARASHGRSAAVVGVRLVLWPVLYIGSQRFGLVGSRVFRPGEGGLDHVSAG